MDPTTLSDSLSVKLNNDNPCYLNETLMSENFIETAKKIHAQAYKLMHISTFGIYSSHGSRENVRTDLPTNLPTNQQTDKPTDCNNPSLRMVNNSSLATVLSPFLTSLP